MSEAPKLTQVKCKASASLLPNNLVYKSDTPRQGHTTPVASSHRS